MENFLLLTVLAAIIAIYSLLPEHKKLRVEYSFGNFEKYVLGIIIILMICFYVGNTYIVDYHYENNTFSGAYDPSMIISPFFLIGSINILFTTITILFFDLFTHPFNYSINYLFLVDIMNIILILILFGLVLYKFFSKQVPIKNQDRFIHRINDLYNKEEFNILISLIEENYCKLFDFGDNEKNKHIIKEVMLKMGTEIDSYVENESNVLKENIKIMLLDHNFIERIVKLKPYFGLEIATDQKMNRFFRCDFSDLYFKELVKNEESYFYREIEKTEETLGRYKVSKINRILYKLLHNLNIAEDVRISDIFSSYVLELLVKHGKEKIDIYNEYDENFTPGSEERFGDVVFVCIRFYDILIREGIYQNWNWHLGLYYYYRFTLKICSNYKLNENSEPYLEFSNVYSYFLFEMIKNLIDWIKLVDDETVNITIMARYISCNHENDNIIKSSIICLVQCMETILNTNQIPYSFKQEDIMTPIYELYFDLILSNNPISQKYGEILKRCILKTASKSNFYKRNMISFLNSTYTHKRGNAKLIELKTELNTVKITGSS